MSGFNTAANPATKEFVGCTIQRARIRRPLGKPFAQSLSGRKDPVNTMTQRLQELVVGLLIAGSPIFSGVLHAQSQSQPRDLTQRSLEDLLGVEVVSSASRSNQRVAEAPANVTIVTAEEIMRHGYRTLGELLQNVRGLYLSDDRNHLYLGIRGFDRPGDFNNRVLLMVDGHRINDNIYGMAALDTSFGVDLAIVDRVEIVRGPGSSLYGTNAMFGVINVVTRRPSSSSGLQVGADVSDRATGRADVSYGKSFGRSRGLLVAFNTGQDARGLEDDSFSRFFAKASYRDFSVHASFVSHERILLLPVLGPFAEPRSRALDSRLGMVRVPFPMLIYRNRDEAGGRGVETELRARSPLGVDGSVSYGYQRTRNERGEELTNSPRHVGTARITVPLAEHRVFVAANTRYVSSRLSLNGNRSRSTFLTDATITGLVKPRGLDLVLSVYNIFDERTIGPSWFATGAPHVGRTWRAGVRTSF